MSKNENTCWSCAYRGKVAGSAHIRCKFDWANADIAPPKANAHGKKSGWYNFPINYDPVWQEEPCKAFSKKADPKMVKEKYHPLIEIMAIMK